MSEDTYNVRITSDTRKTNHWIKGRIGDSMVTDAWNNSEYILDADNFVGVEFSASPAKREHSRGAER